MGKWKNIKKKPSYNTIGCTHFTDHHLFLGDALHHAARELGFETASDMIYIKYVEEGASLRKISKMIGFHYFMIRTYLTKMGVKIKNRGGPNNTKNYTADHVRAVCTDGLYRNFRFELFDRRTQTVRLLYCMNCGQVITLCATKLNNLRDKMRSHTCNKIPTPYSKHKRSRK